MQIVKREPRLYTNDYDVTFEMNFSRKVLEMQLMRAGFAREEIFQMSEEEIFEYIAILNALGEKW